MDAKNQMPELDVEELVNRDYRERQRKADETKDERELRSMEAESVRLARKEHERFLRKQRRNALWAAVPGMLYLAAGAGMIFAMSRERVCPGISIALAVLWAMKAAVRFERSRRMWPV